MKFNAPINNFTSGEWSPKMRSLVDAQEYGRSCKEITNMIVQMQGGAQFRAGTSPTLLPISAPYQTALNSALTAGGVDPSKDFRIIPYYNSNPNFNTVFLFMTGSNPVQLLTGTAVDTTGLGNTTGWSMKDVQYAQVGDYLILTCATGSFEPVIIYHSFAASGFYYCDKLSLYMTPGTSNQIIPYLPIEALGSSVSLSMAGGGPYVVGGSYTMNSSSGYFNVLMVGKYIRLAEGTTIDSTFRITGVTNSTTATVQMVFTRNAPSPGFQFGSATNAASFWQTSAWGGNTGWPRTVASFQGRLIFGGTSVYPDTIWGSRISSIFDFKEIPNVDTTGISGYASTAFASDNSRPFQMRPTVAQSSYITSLTAGKTLTIHTNAAEIVAFGTNGALGPVNAEFTSSTSFGGSTTQGVRINGFETFVQANGYKVRDIIYNFNQDQYNSTDLSFLAEHMFLRENNDNMSVSNVAWPVDEILECAKYEGRSSLMLAKTRRGLLRYVTLDRDYKVNAWGRIVLGYDSTPTYPYTAAPMVLAVGTLNSGTFNAIYLVTKRTFNGTARVCVELITQLAVESDNIQPPNTSFSAYAEPGNYLDYATKCVPVGATPTTSWTVQSGASTPRYPNTTVSVFADGSYIGEVTLGTDNDGAFTLARAASYVTVGFKYKGRLVTSGIESGGQFGIPLGRPKRLDKVVTRFHKTGSGKIGRDDQLEEFVMRPAGIPMNQPTPYFTGDKEVTFPLGYEKDYSVTIEQDKPYPMYIVSIAAHGMSYD